MKPKFHLLSSKLPQLDNGYYLYLCGAKFNDLEEYNLTYKCLMPQEQILCSTCALMALVKEGYDYFGQRYGD